MTVQMCLLCFTAAFLLIHTTKAQGIPGYVPPLYNVPKYVNQGLNAYRQTQQIAKAASGLGLPVPQTQKIVANVALPLIPPAQKLATNVGLSLLPATQRLGTNVGLPLLPKIFPSGLPVLPQIPPTFAVGTKLRPLSASTLLLNTNPSIPRISPLQIRSTDNKTNTEKDQANTAEEEKFEEQANAAINPINEASDDEFKEVIGSSGSFNNDTTDEVHQTKTRSPDNKGDELDYLSKAANPIDDIGSLIKKVSHGLKHTMEKIDTTLWPSHAKPEMKVDLYTTPFNEWANLPENRNKTYEELSAEWGAKRLKMPISEWYKLPENKNKTYLELSAEWLDRLNASRDPAYRLPSELGELGSSNPLLQMKEAGFLSTPFVVWARRPENRHLTHEQKVSKYIDELTESVRQGYPQPSVMDMKANNAEPEINPMNKLFESAAKLADSFIDAMSRSGKNRNEMSESGQTNNPINTYWKKASDLAGQMANSKYPGAVRGEAGQLNDSNDWQKVIDLANQMTDSSKDKEFSSNQRNFPFMHGTIAMDQKDAQFGTHPNGYFYSNQPMPYPYSAAFGGTYNQWNQPGYISPIFDPAASSAHGISRFNNAGGFYKSKNPSEILSNPMTQYTAMFPVLSRTYRQMPPPPLPPYGRPNPIGGLAHATVDTVRTALSGRKPLPPPPSPLPFERPPSPPFGIPPPPNFEPVRVDGPRSFGSRHVLPQGGPLIKRSGSPANIWDSATGLADSIRNIATNPGKTNAGQILGSTGTIFNAAKDLPGDIDSDKLLGSSKLSDSLLNPINPIGKIVNSASSLGSQITNIALNPANVVNSESVKSAEPLSLANQAVGMAGQIVNTALNPEMNGKGQLLQSLGPTYAGGFFPRNNPSGSIVNSATQLASQILNTAATNPGNIGKIPLLKATPGIGNYAGALPLGSIFNSATKLAGDITNVATAPGKLLVR
ncbi:uncharacterized protein LOC100680141 isoform X3 [Nasonia vitripennis]|uniref:Uncharacterized protein n=1 Tax=Nasonia vitripennis TaxID=7425 RepID=A0A7M7QPE5_NASVI|nr:uncharacterized protein LOC100680141 isoform X3 [Nasonia vitripennis]